MDPSFKINGAAPYRPECRSARHHAPRTGLHQDVRHALGELVRLLERSRVADTCGIENRDVRARTGPELTAVWDAHDGGGQRRHAIARAIEHAPVADENIELTSG